VYKIIAKTSVEKDFQSIDRQYHEAIINKIDALKNDPYPPNVRKLAGSQITYRIRVGDYRVIYQVNETDKAITIARVRHRKDVYQE
jgi:mRNA interferase RelE/StbE